MQLGLRHRVSLVWKSSFVLLGFKNAKRSSVWDCSPDWLDRSSISDRIGHFFDRRNATYGGNQA